VIVTWVVIHRYCDCNDFSTVIVAWVAVILRYCDCNTYRYHPGRALLHREVCHREGRVGECVYTELCSVLYHWGDCSCRRRSRGSSAGRHTGPCLLRQGKLAVSRVFLYYPLLYI